MKTAQLRRAMRAALGAAPRKIGIFDAGREADTLLCLQLHCDTASLLLRAEQPLPDTDCEEAMKLCARRLAGEPLQYICGETDFFGLRFAVRPGVLIPRQDSEILAEEALREEILRSKLEMLTRIAAIAGVEGALELEVTINEQIRAVRPIKLEDRLRHMNEKNPLLAELRRELDLEVE